MADQKTYQGNATLGTRLENGDFVDMAIPERATVRHGWASQIEVGTRADGHDACPSPYQNWGFRDQLDFTLAQLREVRDGMTIARIS
jgi:hypothetical protein